MVGDNMLPGWGSLDHAGDGVSREARVSWWVVVVFVWFVWGSALLDSSSALLERGAERLELLRACGTLGNCCTPQTAARAEALFSDLNGAYFALANIQRVLTLIVVVMAFRTFWLPGLPWWLRIAVCLYAIYACILSRIEWSVA